MISSLARAWIDGPTRLTCALLSHKSLHLIFGIPLYYLQIHGGRSGPLHGGQVQVALFAGSSASDVVRCGRRSTVAGSEMGSDGQLGGGPVGWSLQLTVFFYFKNIISFDWS